MRLPTFMSRDGQSNVIKMLVELSDQASQREKDMTSLLAMKVSLVEMLQDLRNATRNTEDKTKDMSPKLSNIATTLSKWATEGNRLATEQRILKSLRFRSMKMRHAQIPEAHKRTFEWAFVPRSTSGDSCAQFKFADWLRFKNGIFWVAGKPGSGKSTLVKFLCDNPRTISELRLWAGNKDLVTASFFFWNSGTEMQRSVEGLLQSLLFEILRKCPTLMPVAVPTRWAERACYRSDSAPWSQWELKETFGRIQQQGTISAKFCLFIDGLDEYDGSHLDVIQILKGLAESEDVKICLSSRPWNVFQEAFGHEHDCKLFLEDITKHDIELYVRNTLEASSHFMSLRERDSRYQGLVDEIVNKADGVFLWVFLIVRSLLQGLVNCDRISELQRRIWLLPSKLEDYFLHILVTTDETYRERAAETFDVALQASQPLSLMTFSYLDEEDSCFAINAGVKPLGCQEVLYRLRTMKRRLNARCNGLLEITNFDEVQSRREFLRKNIDDFWDISTQFDDTQVSEFFLIYKVEFLHRTVRDFLNTKDMQNIIKSRVATDFQPVSAICQAILAQIKALPMKGRFQSRHLNELAEDLIYYTQVSERNYQRPEVETLDEFERTMFILKLLCHIEGASESLEKKTTIELLQHCFIGCMVQNGLCEYVSHKLHTCVSLPSIKTLLGFALRSSVSLKHGSAFYPSMVRLLIDMLREDRSSLWSKIELSSLWTDLLISIPAIWKRISKDAKLAQLQIIQMLLDIGADPNQKHNGNILWTKTLEELRCAAADRKEDIEMIGKYQNIFLSYDMDQSSTCIKGMFF